MKTDVILYKASIDGTYSTVVKEECSRSFAEDVLKNEHSDYFKTFSEAKKEVLDHMTEQLNHWKEAIADIRSLKKSDVELTED